MKFIRLITFLLLASLLICASSNADDNRVFCPSTSASCQIANGVQWTSGNQTWIFRPQSPEFSLYVFIHNNNPTTAHTSQLLTVWQTPSLTVNSLNNNSDLWTQDTVAQHNIPNASCNNIAVNVTNTA